MKTRARIAIFFLFAAAAAQLPGRERSAFLESFEHAGRTYSLDAAFSPGRADLVLSQGSRTVNLSEGMEGENILLGTRAGNENFYVFWLNYRQKTNRLAYYDHNRQRSRLLPLPGFSSFGLPEVLETNGTLQALVFLGNNSDNVDIFHYELATAELTPLTRTPFSEKEIILQETDNGLEIETRSLWAKYRYDFDRRTRQSRMLMEERFSRPQKTEKLTVAVTPEFYNTYIGFGDSITAGQIEQVLHPELCYLTVMKEMLALTYGPAFPINLGIQGQDTLNGAQRVDAELETHPAFYFLLMMGVNDVQQPTFDLADSLENLGYIVDAALADGRRVIVSTLTPRKDKPPEAKYWSNLHALSSGILALAAQKGTASIDTLSAFMNYNPPDGWKSLLERQMTVIVDGAPVQSKGNHPNAAGQRLIASLFAPALATFPPLPPEDLTVLDPENRLQRNVQWDPGYESDLSHYHIEFGFKPSSFDYSLDNAASHYTFNLFPFLPQIYFRIQAVDRGGNASVFSGEKASPAASPQIKIRK
jgi:lysophospholipase L1-like esterase